MVARYSSAVAAVVVAAVSCSVQGEDRVAERLHGDSIFDTSQQVDESERVQLFRERHGTYPDPSWLDREIPSYSRAMAEREAEVMATSETQQDRWDKWMFIAQARLLGNFTEKQWEVTQAPKNVHDRLYASMHAQLTKPRREKGFSGVLGPTPADFVDQEQLNYWVLDELLPLHEAWAGVELVPTSVYGVRIYREGSTLTDHLDIPETHVISSILHIDSKLDAPFPIEIQDATGKYAGVDLKPGQMMFYESAKCFHRRSVPMRGDYYGSLFLHYRPKNWTFSRENIRYAVPPFWQESVPPPAMASSPVGTEEPELTSPAPPPVPEFDEDDDYDEEDEEQYYDDEEEEEDLDPGGNGVAVIFRLASGTGPYDVTWVGDGEEAVLARMDRDEPVVRINTFVGHAFVVYGPNRVAVATYIANKQTRTVVVDVEEDDEPGDEYDDDGYDDEYEEDEEDEEVEDDDESPGFAPKLLNVEL